MVDKEGSYIVHIYIYIYIYCGGVGPIRLVQAHLIRTQNKAPGPIKGTKYCTRGGS